DHLTAILRRYFGSADRRALVVDDDTDLRQHPRDALEKEGWEGGVAAHGREGRARPAEQRPGGVPPHPVMPGLARFEVLAGLQQQEEVRSVPIVILTAKDLTVADRQRLSGRIEKILQKGSLSHDQLLAEVGAVMASHPRRR